jgi:hypothetical protein
VTRLVAGPSRTTGRMVGRPLLERRITRLVRPTHHPSNRQTTTIAPPARFPTDHWSVLHNPIELGPTRRWPYGAWATTLKCWIVTVEGNKPEHRQQRRCIETGDCDEPPRIAKTQLPSLGGACTFRAETALMPCVSASCPPSGCRLLVERATSLKRGARRCGVIRRSLVS